MRGSIQPVTVQASAASGIFFIFLATEHPGGCDIWKTFTEIQLKNKATDHEQMNLQDWMEMGSMPLWCG